VIAAHLPVLQVVVPLMAAPFVAFFRKGSIAWLIALVVSWLAFAISVALLERVLTTGDISYAIGDFAPPWGIEYKIDKVNAFVLLIVSSIGAVVTTFARRSVEKEVPEEKQVLFYSAFLLCLTGLLGITVTGDAFNIFVFLEISSLSSYTLIAMGRDRRALTAAFQYLVMGTIGATFILIGIGLIYMMTGTLNIADMADRIAGVEVSAPIVAAAGFIFVGVGLKLALFPLHLWLPNAYTYAPSMITAFLAATATKVSVYVMLRFMFTIFGPFFTFELLPMAPVLVFLSAIAILTASTVAIFQNNVKRMLAYSSVAQIGYMVLGIAMVSATGLTAGILHLFNHALMKGGLFMALGCVAYRLGAANLDTIKGLGRRMPLTMFAFVIGGLSLIGVPLTAGFVSKWYLVLGALEKGWWPVAAIILVGSLLAVIYIWRIVEAAYFQAPADGAAAIRQEAPLSMLIPTWVLIGANIYFGIDTHLSVSVARQAAAQLLGLSP